MLVIDASAVVEQLLRRPLAEQVDRATAAHEGELSAPHLLDVEVLHALRRQVAAGETSAVRAGEAVDDLLDFAVERHRHEALLRRAWTLRDSFTVYDATYVALAELLGARLLTTDARLARAVEAHSDVEVLLAD